MHALIPSATSPLRTIAPLLLALTSILLCAGSTRAAGTLYAITFGAPGSLYTVDTSTGAASFVAGTGVTQPNGIAFDAANNLYANANNDKFYRIDRITGATTQVGSSEMFIFPLEGDLAYYPATGNFLAADSVHANLYSINKSNGSAAVIGGWGSGLDMSGLAFGPGGVLYGLCCNNSGPASLVTIDPVSGGINSTVGLTGTLSGGLAGLAYDPHSSSMYLAIGTPGTPSPSSLYTLDLGTGAATLIGPMGINSVSGLAFLVPEPSATCLLASGAVLLLSRRPRLKR